MENLIRDGMGYCFKRGLTETERRTKRGMHKPAEEGVKESSHTLLLAKDDVAHGLSIPLSPEMVNKSRGAMVQPMRWPPSTGYLRTEVKQSQTLAHPSTILFSCDGRRYVQP